MTPPKPNPGILDIAAYVPGKSSAKGAPRVVKLSSNETPLGASPKAIGAFKEAAATLHRYPDGGATKLREAIAEVYELPADRLVCGAGSDELIGLLIHAYAGHGDNIVMSEHGFLMYKIYAQGFGVETLAAPEKNLRADVGAMLARVNARTKIVFIANPNNPTGSYITKDELARLHDGLPEHVILAVDAAYSEYADRPDYADGSELAASAANVVMLRTFSKIYGLSALRVGWMYAPLPIIDAINRVRGPFNVSTPAIAAGIAAVRDRTFTADAKVFNARWLEWLSREVAALGLRVYPSIANFLLIQFRDAAQAEAACLFLAEHGLVVREVTAYGLPRCLRISIGLEEDNRQLVALLKIFLGK